MVMEADQAGTVEFRYLSPQAIELFLVGSFNGWNPHAQPMHRSGDGDWVCSIRLPVGVYQFHYLARLAEHDHPLTDRRGPRSQWSCSGLEMVVVTPRGGSFQMGPMRASDAANDGASGPDATEDSIAIEGMKESLLPLSRLEAALIRGFRRLPDHESRSAFLDVMEESVYS